MLTSIPQMNALDWALIVGLGGKVFLMAARSMPEPLPTCGFYWRWFYEFMQLAAENHDRSGKSRQPADEPQDKP